MTHSLKALSLLIFKTFCKFLSFQKAEVGGLDRPELGCHLAFSKSVMNVVL